ncbi:MAG: hypothetical protein AB1942_03340 [Pseudomonadota bacterium]
MLWDMTLVEFLDGVGLPAEPRPFERLAADLNLSNADHADEVVSFEAVYLQEARGAATFGAREGLAIIFEMARQQGVAPLEDAAAGTKRSTEIVTNLIAAVLLKPDLRTRLPMLHVMASITPTSGSIKPDG